MKINHMNIPMLISIKHTSFFFFFILLIITNFFLQKTHSLPPKPQPDHDYSLCKKQSYKCGKLSDISYPFWGQNRPSYCGAGEPFHLHCNNNQDTTILLSSQNFTVLNIDTKTYIIKLKRTDLAQNICSPQFNDTLLPPNLFQPHQDFKNLIINYNCTSSQNSPEHFPECNLCESPNHKFYIGDDGFKYLEESKNCKRRVQVPVEADFLIENIDDDGYIDNNDLKRGLDKGFEVYYVVNGECLQCSGNQEDCRWINTSAIEKHFDPPCHYDICPGGFMASSAAYCPSHHNSQWSLKRKLVVGVVGSAIMVALLMGIIICCIRGKLSIQQVKFRFKAKNDKNIEAFFKEHGALTQKKYKFSEIKKMTNSFKVKLGQGGFGVVYKGKLFNGYPVAVKILNATKRNDEEFINEVASITRTSHVNVVNLLGFCFEGRKKALVYEFMSNGSLDKFIYNKGPETIEFLSWDDLHQIAKGIARGLEYLHRGCSTRILHFDIKPHNILLDENFNPKISDFGLAKLCPRRESIISMSNQRGTMGYVAPEVWNRHFGGVSHKSDVYSYGMMLLEMVGGRKNINADASHTSEIYFPHWVYSRLELASDLRPKGAMDTKEDVIAKRMTIVGLWCIQTFPNDRPTMSKVVEMLEGSTSSLKIPPKPLLSSPTRSLSES